eukprot:g52695.t1
MLVLLGGPALLVGAQVLNYPCQPTVGGAFFDLTPLKRSGSFYQGQDLGGQRYELNVCGIINDGKSCQQAGAAMCQVTSEGDTVIIASATSGASPTFSLIDSSDPNQGVQLVFDNEPYPPQSPCYPLGTKRKATIRLQCVPGASAPTIPLMVQEASVCNYQTVIPSKYGCPAPVGGWPKDAEYGGGGLSGGSVLLILFIPGAFLYLAIGILYKRKTQGTTGVESIPNIEFWRALPQLVKDGVQFTMSGCKRNAQHDFIAQIREILFNIIVSMNFRSLRLSQYWICDASKCTGAALLHTLVTVLFFDWRTLLQLSSFRYLPFVDDSKEA